MVVFWIARIAIVGRRLRRPAVYYALDSRCDRGASSEHEKMKGSLVSLCYVCLALLLFSARDFPSAPSKQIGSTQYIKESLKKSKNERGGKEVVDDSDWMTRRLAN